MLIIKHLIYSTPRYEKRALLEKCDSQEWRKVVTTFRFEENGIKQLENFFTEALNVVGDQPQGNYFIEKTDEN